MGKNILVSIVLGSYNRLTFLKRTIQSIRAEVIDIPHEIIIIDGGSTDGSLKWLSKQKDIITIIQHNRGKWHGQVVERKSWGYFMNLGFKCVKGKYICMLSDDCLVIPGAIKNGCNHFESETTQGKRVGAIAFYWRNWPKQEKYWVGTTLGAKMFVNHGLYLTEALKDVSYIDEETYSFYHADGDLCLKLWQKNYICIDSPNSFIEHFVHANIRIRQSNGKRQKNDWENYLSKWENIFYQKGSDNTGGWIEKEYHDPYHTANKYPFFWLYWTLRKLL